MKQKTAPTAVGAMWESDCLFTCLPGSLHRNQPSAKRVTKSVYFSFSMTLAKHSATITSPMIRVLSYGPRDCCVPP